MYRTGRRSAAGIANWVRRDSVQNSMHPPVRMSDDEEHEPIYSPKIPSDQGPQHESAEDAAPTQPLPYHGDYASSDGYQSLMAFNSQQRTAGKLSSGDKISREDAFALRDHHRSAPAHGARMVSILSISPFFLHFFFIFSPHQRS